MADDLSFSIAVVRGGDEFTADVLSESDVNGVADLRLRGVGLTARFA